MIEDARTGEAPLDVDALWLDEAADAGTREQSAQRELEAAIEAARRPGARTVVGPWHSEVGFEVLYWIPFLRQLVAAGMFDPATLVAVSRGGVAPWYADICDSYVEIFDTLTPERYRRSGESRRFAFGGQKQKTVSALDRRLLAATGVARRGKRTPLLHPSVMYGLFRRFWKGGQAIEDVVSRLRFVPVSAPRDEEVERLLPDEPFVAARFYFRDSFPDTPENRAFVREAIESIAAERPVVLLNVGMSVDDHAELDPELSARVERPLLGVAANRNLLAQSVVLARAESFVGTYGGMSYVALMYGIPGISVASNREWFFPTHLDVARRAAQAIDVPFDVVDTTALACLPVREGVARAVAA